MVEGVGQSQGIPGVAVADVTEIQHHSLVAHSIYKPGGLGIQLALGVGDHKGFSGFSEDVNHGHTEQTGLFGAGGAENQGVGVLFIHIHMLTVGNQRQTAYRAGGLGHINICAGGLHFLQGSPAGFLIAVYVLTVLVSIHFNPPPA